MAKKNDVNESKIKGINSRYIKANLNDYQNYLVESVTDWDTPKMRNSLKFSEANPNTCINEKGTTILHYAAARQDVYSSELGGLDMINVLLSSGADAFLKDENGLTPYDYAMLKNNTNNARLIKKHMEREEMLRERRRKLQEAKEKENQIQEKSES
jgi:ankyrin repeat protein